MREEEDGLTEQRARHGSGVVASMRLAPAWCRGRPWLWCGELTAAGFFAARRMRGDKVQGGRRGKEPLCSPIYSRGGVTGALVRNYHGVGRIECGQETLWPRLWLCISHTQGGTEWQRLCGIACSGVRRNQGDPDNRAKHSIIQWIRPRRR